MYDETEVKTEVGPRFAIYCEGKKELLAHLDGIRDTIPRKMRVVEFLQLHYPGLYFNNRIF